MDMKPGFLAKSLAGNDKGKIYVIKEDHGEYVFLLGKKETVTKKNKKHVQLIKKTKETYALREEGNKKICQNQM